MIGVQPTGTLPGVVISATATERLRVEIDGQHGRLAVINDEGQIVASGPEVAREVRAVSVNSYRRFLEGTGRLRVLSQPIEPDVPASR